MTNKLLEKTTTRFRELTVNILNSKLGFYIPSKLDKGVTHALRLTIGYRLSLYSKQAPSAFSCSMEGSRAIVEKITGVLPYMAQAVEHKGGLEVQVYLMIVVWLL